MTTNTVVSAFTALTLLVIAINAIGRAHVRKVLSRPSYRIPIRFPWFYLYGSGVLLFTWAGAALWLVFLWIRAGAANDPAALRLGLVLFAGCILGVVGVPNENARTEAQAGRTPWPLLICAVLAVLLLGFWGRVF